MADVDLRKVRELADSAEKRALDCHKKYDAARDRVRVASSTQILFEKQKEAAGHLNDFFYWAGHKNAYLGIVVMAELQTIVEDELDAEGSCP